MLKKSIVALVLAVGFMFTLGAGQSNADAIYNPGGSGDLLFGQVYDVRAVNDRPAAWENYFTIRNTSNRWVAFHIRFRSQTKSIEVWDHIVLLSPYDVFWFDLQRAADGGVVIYSADAETLQNSGWVKKGETEFSDMFSTELLESCGYTTGVLAETEMGYMEAIGVWSLPSSSHVITSLTYDSYKDPNDAGAINVYDILANMWSVTAGTPRITGNPPWVMTPSAYTPTSANYNSASPVVYPFEDCPNVLQGEFEMGDVVTGNYQLSNMVAVAGFRTDGTGGRHRDQNWSGVIGYPVELLLPGSRCYTTSLPAWYLNPGVNTTVGPTLVDGDAWGPLGFFENDGWEFNAGWSLWALEEGLWSYERWAYYYNANGEAPFNADIKTDVYATFPTKHQHYWFRFLNAAKDDYIPWPWFDGSNFTNCGVYWNEVNDRRATIKASWDSIKNGPCFVDGGIWDSDQNQEKLSPAPSPSPWVVPVLPEEVNVVRVGAPGLLYTDYVHGQFMLTDWIFPSDQRAALINYTPGPTDFPMLGLTARIHSNPGSPYVTRSAMAPMQFKSYLDDGFFVTSLGAIQAAKDSFQSQK